MRVVVIDEPGSVAVREFPDPEPGPGEVVIDVRACGFCGTDLHIFRGEYLGDYPVRPGHEAAGVVTSVGEDVEGLKGGDRVAIEPNIHCGTCDMCTSGRGNFCENWTAIGVTLPGCMAEKVLAPAGQVFAIGDLSFEAGAFMEPLSCVLHGMRKIEPLADEDVLITGAGPIGLLLLQLAKLRGAKNVTVTDLREARLQLARDLGADEAMPVSPSPLEGEGRGEGYLAGDPPHPNPLPPGERESKDVFDVVIDASGNVEAISETVDLARPGGKILWFGVAPRGETFPIEPFRVFRKGLAIHSAYTSLGNSTEAVELLSSGKIRVEPLISHRLPLEEFEHAAELIESDPDVLKVTMVP
ncbi:MAG: hypothetical protein AMS16_02110 [Planctomycetes bacterium DG_58]|nr:MAG: hypothetical protein AMS16_02110 [Planctomycetes bacterium DG_58]